MRLAVLVIATAMVGSTAHADDKPAVARADTKPASPPDEITDVESREANLESVSPRSGLVFAFAVGFGVLAGGDIGVGRGGSLSARVGHVATRRTVITFEISGTGAQHKPAMQATPLTDSNAGFFAGAQTYASTSTWLRFAAGPTVFTKDLGGNERTAGGVGGLVSGGLDLVRRGYFVLGFEVLAMSSFTSDGFKLQLGFMFGLSHY